MTDKREQELRAEAVRVLTRAAEYAQQHRESFDFPRFVGQVLVTTSANLGGTKQLMGHNRESWEAHHVAALSWTHSPEANLTYGPSPVVVPVNVAEIVEADELHPGLLGLDAAIDGIGYRYANVKSDSELDAWDDEIVAVESRYQREYLAYVDRFAAAAQAGSPNLGLDAGVYIAADTNPLSCWWNEGALVNPREGIDSKVVCAVWNFAHDNVALPNVDLDYGESAAHHLSRGV